MGDQEHVKYSDAPAVGTASADETNGVDDVSFLEVASIILRQRTVLVRTVLVFTAMSFLVAITRPTVYTSSASFLPESGEGSQTGALALAQQFGMMLGRANERTPQFYADLVTSDEILRRTVVSTYPFADSGQEVDLIAYYGIDEKTPEQELERTIVELGEDLSAGIDRETGVVSFSVTTSDPHLSRGVAAQIVELINDFDLNTRQSQAGAERIFTGERLVELRRELRVAEDSLKGFLVENRVFDNSPQLQFQHDRLQRAVLMRQELVTSVAQTFERARLEEVRNTPVITMIAPPRVAAFRDPKRRILILVLGVIAGSVIGGMAAFGREFLKKGQDAEPNGYAQFQALKSETIAEIKRLFRIRPPRAG